MAELRRQSTVAPIEPGDVFRDRSTGRSREVVRVVTHHGDRQLARPYANVIGERQSRIRLDRLADRRQFERMWPTWKAIEDARGSTELLPRDQRQ